MHPDLVVGITESSTFCSTRHFSSSSCPSRGGGVGVAFFSISFLYNICIIPCYLLNLSFSWLNPFCCTLFCLKHLDTVLTYFNLHSEFLAYPLYPCSKRVIVINLKLHPLALLFSLNQLEFSRGCYCYARLEGNYTLGKATGRCTLKYMCSSPELLVSRCRNEEVFLLCYSLFPPGCISSPRRRRR